MMTMMLRKLVTTIVLIFNKKTTWWRHCLPDHVTVDLMTSLYPPDESADPDAAVGGEQVHQTKLGNDLVLLDVQPEEKNKQLRP